MQSNSFSRHAQQVLTVAHGQASGPGSDPSIARSWLRCLEDYHLDPARAQAPVVLEHGRLLESRESLHQVLQIADPEMNSLHQQLSGAGHAVLLTDARGVILNCVTAPSERRIFERAGLWLGADWSEAREGTNGIGTCIAEQRVLTIHRDQHFHTRNIGLSCTVAPLFDPTGRLAGALDVSSCRPGLEGLSGLIERIAADAARRIETRAFRETFPKARIVLLPEQGVERASVPMLAVDSDDVVIGATRAARQALKLTDEILRRGLPSPDRSADLDEAERAAVRRALSQSGGNVSAAAALLGLSRATLNRKLKRLDLARGREFH